MRSAHPRKKIFFVYMLIIISLLLSTVSPVLGAAPHPGSVKTAERESAVKVNEQQAQTPPQQSADVDDVPIEGSPTLELTMWVRPLDAAPGEVITYAIALRNYGVDPIETIIVEDRMPEGLVYVQKSAEPGLNYDAAAKQLNWQLDVLAAGELQRRTFRARVQGRNMGEEVSNVVSAFVGEHTFDS
ncbi:MAG: DUF11 domain-containing protein, partial [Chloroflexi bacterium]|nr:DUF11 domain-containing protein [Chloroflexota bacterium]